MHIENVGTQYILFCNTKNTIISKKYDYFTISQTVFIVSLPTLLLFALYRDIRYSLIII